MRLERRREVLFWNTRRRNAEIIDGWVREGCVWAM
jgi:hypothetical protein